MKASAFNARARESSVRRKTAGSLERFERAQRSLAGGVSSALRRAARPYPLYFTHGEGARAVDVDGNTYIDYGLAWGPLIVGHAHPEVTRAMSEQLQRALTFGAQHDLEIEVAEMLTGIIPCADLVCFASSGTEIVQVALRLARAATGRQKFVKFEGHYHGWDDSVLVSYKPTRKEIAAAGGAPIPVAAGQRPHDQVIVAEWNDQAGIEEIFAARGDEISAVICEPLLCNNGCIPPAPGFLELLRELTAGQGALLVFDEVITGFRLHLRGAQHLCGVTPDLATYAKAVGGGASLSVLAGKREFMQLIADGRALHGGTLNGNPLSLAAARAVLKILARHEGAVYTEMWRHGERLRFGLEAVLRGAGFEVVTSGAGPVFQVSFMSRPARNYRETLDADRELYSDFALALLDEGVLVLPDGRWYISAAHTDEQINATLDAAARVVKSFAARKQGDARRDGTHEGA
jgi:glutamate-1-semialdehyde 2,1-aminomutase